MKTALLAIALTLFGCSIADVTSTEGTPDDADKALTPLSVFADAFSTNKSNIQVLQKGEIITLLADDTDGDRHQRMIVRLANNQTLLIAHNIDIGARVPAPVKGNELRFYGVYEWNSEGGVVHWTHKDPSGDHVDGWLEYDGKRYE